MSSTNWPRTRVRTAFLSDLHLGTRDCRATEIIQFLQGVEADELYLVGDVVDLWSMRRSIYWPAQHHEVLKLIVAKARSGTRVVYVPGNHDELARGLVGSVLAGVEVQAECVHTTRGGQRLLVIHGDAFDGAVRFSPLLKVIGCALYGLVMFVGRQVNLVRAGLGMPSWSLATWIKSRIGNAQQYVERFEHAAARAAVARGLDGIVCGHIHRPCIARIDGVLYCNDGDWVEHCTALIEDRNGQLRIWHQATESVAVPAGTAASLRDAA